jgi:hypothetical protein
MIWLRSFTLLSMSACFRAGGFADSGLPAEDMCVLPDLKPVRVIWLRSVTLLSTQLPLVGALRDLPLWDRALHGAWGIFRLTSRDRPPEDMCVAPDRRPVRVMLLRSPTFSMPPWPRKTLG